MLDTKSFFDAIRAGRGHEISAALDERPDLANRRDEQGLSPILVALYHGHADVARELAARARELDVFEAAALGDAARLRAIVSADRGVANAHNADGFTPLGLAAFFKRTGAVRLLLEAGADANAASRNAPRFSPLHSAVATDAGAVEVAIVVALVEAGADPNARSAQGTTPLHTAAFVGDARVVRYLLAHGADITVKSDQGQTAGEIALQRGMAEVAQLLARKA